MLFAAANLSQQMDADSFKMWMQIGLVVLVFGTVFIVLWRMSRIILTLLALGVILYVGYAWFWEREEPEFLTPFVEAVSPMLKNLGGKVPSRDARDADGASAQSQNAANVPTVTLTIPIMQNASQTQNRTQR